MISSLVKPSEKWLWGRSRCKHAQCSRDLATMARFLSVGPTGGSGMSFILAEQFSCGKAIGGYSEDRIILSDNHFGILDGSRGPDISSPDVITAILNASVDYLQSMPPHIDLPTVLEDLSGITAQYKAEAGFSDYRRSGGFVFCLYSNHFNEIWRVGDCKFRNGGMENSLFWQTEKTCAEARSLILHSMLDAGMTREDVMADPGYDHVIDTLLHYESSFLNRENNPRSFGAIIGLEVPQTYIERYPAQPGLLVVTSDGYPGLWDSLEETETVLSRLLERDPLCIEDNLQCKGLGPGRVSFDDRAYISAEITG